MNQQDCVLYGSFWIFSTCSYNLGAVRWVVLLRNQSWKDKQGWQNKQSKCRMWKACMSTFFCSLNSHAGLTFQDCTQNFPVWPGGNGFPTLCSQFIWFLIDECKVLGRRPSRLKLLLGTPGKLDISKWIDTCTKCAVKRESKDTAQCPCVHTFCYLMEKKWV